MFVCRVWIVAALVTVLTFGRVVCRVLCAVCGGSIGYCSHSRRTPDIWSLEQFYRVLHCFLFCVDATIVLQILAVIVPMMCPSSVKTKQYGQNTLCTKKMLTATICYDLDNGERVHSSSVWSMRIYFYVYCETYLFFVFLHICWQIFVNVGFYLCPFIHLMNECIKVASYLSETLPMLVCKWHSFLSFCYLVC